jgi:hypothetical protein
VRRDDAIAHLVGRLRDWSAAGPLGAFLGVVRRPAPRAAPPLLYYRGGYAQLER